MRYILDVADSTSDRKLHGAHVGARGALKVRVQHIQGVIRIALESGLPVNVTTTDDPDYEQKKQSV
jgi:hypothetical protein